MNKKNITVAIMLMFIFTAGVWADSSPARFKTYKPTWESLNQHDTPEWLLDAKFGIYGHWGIYSIPAFKTEWYGRLMYDKQTRGEDVFNHHIKKYGKQSEFGYVDFIKDFTAPKYDPDQWAELIAKSGAKFAGITVVHHDGYCLWDSKFTRWDSKDTGPKRDLYGELVASLRKTDPTMKILTCFHHFRTYGWFYTKDAELLAKGKKEGWDIFDPEYADFYWNPETQPRDKFIKEWKSKVKEVIDNYQPDVIWFDGGGFRKGENEPDTLEVLAHYYNTQKKKGTPVEVVNKKSNFHPDFGLRNFEKGGDRPAKVDFDWADDLNIASRGWCYTEDMRYRPSNAIIDGFIDRVSRGGCLMLSISPKGDGSIPDEQQKILLDMGKWLAVNGKGIYGTRKWKIETEGELDKILIKTGKKTLWNFDGTCDANDVRFTCKGDKLFGFILGWPEDGKVVIKSLGTDVKVASGGIADVKLMGYDGKLKWSRSKDGLAIEMPDEKPCEHAFGFEIIVKGKLLN
ncbi:MAG: alpha-L-fucosidase [Phycisphaerae bacterium]|nr:alpha-L-fucosidase [Phycisphaerae bacterium]